MANPKKGQVTEAQVRILVSDYGIDVVQEATTMYRTLWKDGQFR